MLIDKKKEKEVFKGILIGGREAALKSGLGKVPLI